MSENAVKSKEEKRKKKSQQSNLFGPNRDLNSNANSKSNEPPRKFLGHGVREDQGRGSLHVLILLFLCNIQAETNVHNIEVLVNR